MKVQCRWCLMTPQKFPYWKTRTCCSKEDCLVRERLYEDGLKELNRKKSQSG